MVLFTCLVLLSIGWAITRPALTDWERRRLTALLLLLVFSYALYTAMHGFFLFFLVILYVVTLRFMFAAITANNGMLLNQLHLLRRLDNDTSRAPVSQKLQLFKRLQISLVVYISAAVIFNLWATIFLRNTPWVEDAIEFVLQVLMALAVGFSVR